VIGCDADTATSSRVRWVIRGGTAIGWVCIGCGAECAATRAAAQDAADRHDCRKARFQRELAAANKVIDDAGAVVAEDDGFCWVDQSKLPGDFVEYYAGLTSTGYALGAI
jgi:hypothetical protein